MAQHQKLPASEPDCEEPSGLSSSDRSGSSEPEHEDPGQEELSPVPPKPRRGAYCGSALALSMGMNVVMVLFLIISLYPPSTWLEGTFERRAPPAVRREVARMKKSADKILEHIMEGGGKGRSFKRLADFCDIQGHRLSGSDNLERAIDAQIPLLEAEGFDRVWTEEAMVPHWVRNEESAKILHPLVGEEQYQLHILGLGYSVGTPDGKPLEADVIVVKSFEELERRAAEVKGKIVVTNPVYIGYGETGPYRREGASRAAQYGAVAYLHRAIGPFGLQTPHTGTQYYWDDVEKIPAASLSIHDADLLERMDARTGGKVRIRLQMGAQNLPDRKSRNVLAEIRGSEKPDEVILIGGHFDSWDVGMGAMDDYGGFAISWEILSTLKDLGIRPKRTIRIIGWTAEEVGGQGAFKYFDDHKHEKEKFQLVAESDGGVFDPTGIAFSGNEASFDIMSEIMRLLKPIRANELRGGGGGMDINMWIEAGVPGMSLPNLANRNYTGPGSEVNGPRTKKGTPMGSPQHFQGDYFVYHHTTSDTASVQDPVQMDRCAAVWAVTTFAVANLDEMLPRDATPSPELLAAIPRDDCP